MSHPSPILSMLVLGLVTSGCQKTTEPIEEDSPTATTWYVDDVEEAGSGTEDDPFSSLQDAIDAAASGDSILILEGTHIAEPIEDVDPTCGNCSDEDFRTDIAITVGFRIDAKSLDIRGESREGTVLETGAGYGLYFIDAGTSSVSTLTITGGVRDADGMATDAAIVVKHTDLTVQQVDILENNDLYQGKPDPVVGIMGITGREGAVLSVFDCQLLDNSWDGITLYRSDPEVEGSAPSALIVGNTIGCTTGCVSPNGRGVGIGITWDSEAVVINNVVHDYWKGIGSFGESQATVSNNIVRDQIGWGVIASSDSYMDVINNVITHNGTTGLAAWDSSATGRFINNVVTDNGWYPDEWVGKKTGIWMNSENVEMAYNDVWGNDDEDVCSGGYPGSTPCTAIDFIDQDGNLSVDPGFTDEVDFALDSSSTLIDAGDPSILDADGSVSDMGAYGGPEAGLVLP